MYLKNNYSFKTNKIMTLVKWNNANNFSALNNLVENFLGKDATDIIGRNYGSMPSVNIKEDKDAYYLEVTAPGLKKEDFQISLNNNLLSIAAKKVEEKEETEEKYTRKEFNYSSFQRSFTLPHTIESDKIEAKYIDGVLFVSVPKKEEAKQKEPRKIAII